jgi:hypothetical protein
MNALLAVAADFFEHLTDPSRGRDVNESYGLRFHMLMRDDPEAARQLAAAPLAPDDVEVMSATAWLWYLTWRQSIMDDPPSAAFLDALYDQTTSPIFRLGIVELGAQDVRHGPPESTGLPSGWIDQRIRAILAADDTPGRDEEPAGQDRVGPAWELLTYLLDLGNETSLDAARVLLSSPWSAAGALRERTRGLIARMQLDEESELELRTRLGLA